ncbi:uncharacterized protein Z520_05233 [Fonsecaea multimorphosa CBS 102226]|uniref:Exonuclease domain-containing protein n=1 Tax=Fonsecaea multimorphosa CBS 102226 TaxID=1442371 RepID=A0A0D2JZ24_9EURO|nr:uncharacterized protein Z520_05233 [Fonsecaea multimorphosa CBS 102226]KIX98772.1 hypothetical protein Z520_05233 [Fonsecaea multimorphosa CBS 102226]OAL25053.1 hypothetical protein AYO22_04930 [Fonsecaea multimorphosa]
MTDGGKRKAAGAGFSHADSETPKASNTPHAYSAASDNMNGEGSKPLVSQNWNVAESKSSRKKRRKIERDPDGDPSISFYKSRPERVELTALQGLVLYILADGVAPTWLAVKNVKQIKKVVVLMVPALDQTMLEDSGLWNDISEDGETTDRTKPDKSSSGHDSASQDQNSRSTDTSSIQSLPEAAPKLSSDHQSPGGMRDSLLQHIVEVRAPGDSRMSRVHSPLQGMLIAPFSEASKQKAQNSKDDKSFYGGRTPIVDFIHTLNQLQEAEYPIHPAVFTDPKDAQLEKERRERTGQSASSGWVDTDVSVFRPRVLPSSNPPLDFDFLTSNLKIYALDCEMVLTSDGKHSLARVSLLDWTGKTVMDSYVKPTLAIKDYFTEFSGITEKILENVTTTLEDIQKKLLDILKRDTILLGHSLESDLNALKMTHPFVIDTSIIYPHPRGLPLRSSLKFLAKRYLKREIQKGGMNGHDSVEDARAVLDLVRLKCEKGALWGTLDANGESIFRKIGGTLKMDADEEIVLKTTAMVEYGTPERGLGRDATYKIGCSNDEEIVQGVFRAAYGDSLEEATVAEGGSENGAELKHAGHDGESAPQGPDQAIPVGGADFIWARLRDLEAARGWNTLPSDNPSAPTSSSALGPPLPSDQADHIRSAMRQTLQRIHQIYANLPSRTLLMVYSGTGDMRPLLRLQNLQAQYKREFKVKNWDDLSVKWTDVEEQQMKKACEKARRGVGILALRK